MEQNKADLYVFSGTGNTLLIARRMAEVFRQSGVDTVIHSLTSKTKFLEDSESLLGLIFPVAMQGTYGFIWKFLNNLPEGKGRPVFMADSLGIFSGGIVGPVKKILKRKGYVCIAAGEFYMPHNLLKQHPSGAKAEKKRKKTLQKVEKYAQQILQGQSHWWRIPVISDVMSVISQKEGWWKLYRALFPLRVDADACIACGLCARLCPVDNFEILEVSHPKNQCELCMRCVTFCPKDAITILKKHSFYHAVSSKDLIKLEK